jgi:uncharacterized protein (UPF0276 family)
MDRVMELTTNLSDPLLDLVDNGQAPIDGVEVGPWFSLQQIHAYRQRLPEMPFYFHGGNLIAKVGWFPGAVAKIAAYVQSTGSPWASMHVSMWFPGMVSLMMGRGWRLPRPNVQRATRRLIRQVQRLKDALGVPVILENMPSLPFDGYEFEADPGRITAVLDKTGCSFLLDTGHASVTAAALGLEAQAYVSALPLDRVVQVHVSGPRMQAGRLVDAHQPLQEADYALLGFVLSKTRPRVVTLEYIRERDALRDQLYRLREMVDNLA